MLVARAIPLLRRFAIALVALVLSAFLFRGAVASSLITRGDGAFQAGDLRTALRFYQRSLVFDATSPVGVERITTLAMASSNRNFKEDAIRIASRELAHNPDDVRVRVNRALMLQRLGRNDEAYPDFVILSRTSPNPALVEFVGRLATRRGDFSTARAAYERTLQLNPKSKSARVALARLNARHG